jgi:hypothetical protein
MTSTRLERPFAGRIRAFDVAPLAIIEKLERVCGAGMGEILGRLQGRGFNALTGMPDPVFRHADIRETIRLGLVGGGATDAEATQCVVEAVDGRPIAEHLGLAAAIMTAYAFGVEDALGKSAGPPAKRPRARKPSGPATSPGL